MRLTLFLLSICLAQFASAQQYNDYQLRLEPVWSRVADALGEPGSIESAEFSKDGKYIISASKYDYSVVMWRTSDGAELWRQYVAQEAERAGFSADGKYVAVGSEDYLVTVFDAATGDKLQELKHNNGIDGLTWSNKSSLLVSGEEDSKDAEGNQVGFIRVFDMPEGKEIATINYGATCNELFFTQDDKYLLAAGHNKVRVYETDNWTEVQVLETIEGREVFTAASFSPDGKHIVAASNNPSKGTIAVWEWESGKRKRTFNHTGRKMETVAWHPNGDYILFTGHDSNIWVYRVNDIFEYKNDRIPVAHKAWASDHAEYIDFNEDGSFLVSAHQNGLIKLWVWMGEDPALNERRHKGIKKEQVDYNKNNN
ncbi:MAG: WD40 repeat domain-containing protein [Cyclobacteriaceae bacterium]